MSNGLWQPDSMEIVVYRSTTEDSADAFTAFLPLPTTRDEWRQVLGQLALQVMVNVIEGASKTDEHLALMIEMFPLTIPELQRKQLGILNKRRNRFNFTLEVCNTLKQEPSPYGEARYERGQFGSTDECTGPTDSGSDGAGS